MKYQLYANASKKIDEYMLLYLNDLFGIKLNYLRSLDSTYNEKLHQFIRQGRL